jgi:hypothetical protein
MRDNPVVNMMVRCAAPRLFPVGSALTLVPIEHPRARALIAEADLLIVWLERPADVGAGWVKPGATVIDFCAATDSSEFTVVYLPFAHPKRRCAEQHARPGLSQTSVARGDMQVVNPDPAAGVIDDGWRASHRVHLRALSAEARRNAALYARRASWARPDSSAYSWPKTIS